ncbi:MAG: hypothetical protein NZ921_02325 [Candidatus Caldarchaeum sp.]|nr:hypothetical protein [Candidatus Caldarchaeum sp.]
MFFAAGGAVFYTAWWAGLISFLNPEDAVRLTALIITLMLLLIAGFVGYVMATTKTPQPVSTPTKSSQAEHE